MNTPSHIIINAALRRRFRRRVPIPSRAFLLGGLMPDVPLTLISIGSLVYYRYYLAAPDVGERMRYGFDYQFFNDPLWIIPHNFLHAPVILLLFMAVLWPFRQRIDSVGRAWFWFCAGCLVHTALDIPTHVNDGPLLLFPFNWTTRFYSPISYWDANYYGRQFAVFELVLDVLLLVYLFLPALRRRIARRRANNSVPQP